MCSLPTCSSDTSAVIHPKMQESRSLSSLVSTWSHSQIGPYVRRGQLSQLWLIPVIVCIAVVEEGVFPEPTGNVAGFQNDN